MVSQLNRWAQALEAAGHFTGGPAGHFHAMGLEQLVQLLQAGLLPHHTVLDIGCGALRAGYWLIHLLRPGCYCGIEPNTDMLEAGKQGIVGAEVLAEKAPRFDSNDRFDLAVFGQAFDFLLARSIWSHAGRAQILAMLDGFCAVGKPGAIFLTSYLPARHADDVYTGDTWVGRSHVSDWPKMICHDPDWIAEACAARDLALTPGPFDRMTQQQQWLRIAKAS